MQVEVRLTGQRFTDDSKSADVWLPEGSTVKHAVDAVQERLPKGFASSAAYTPLLLLNGQHTGTEQILHDGDEVWLLYMLTGG